MELEFIERLSLLSSPKEGGRGFTHPFNLCSLLFEFNPFDSDLSSHQAISGRRLNLE
jgi:hypothetical protein